MTLPVSGPMRMGADINVELRVSSTTQISLGQSSVRTLFGVSSGAIRMAADGRGKTNRISLTYTFGNHANDVGLNVSQIGSYISGHSDITIVVNPGVYIWATSTGTPALTIYGANSGDTLRLVNYGYIMGKGGNGGDFNASSSPGAGGPALSIGYPMTIDNTYGTAYIGGGGGAGGGNIFEGGGGGAGGGNGGVASGGSGASGGGIGGAGGSGSLGDGGGGGRIFPGWGGGGGANNQKFGGSPGAGGGAGGGGGGGGGGNGEWGVGGTGGSANGAGNSGSPNNNGAAGGGGGGGWGAYGGNSGTIADATSYGQAGGYAIYLNGNYISWVNGDTSRIYGAVG